MQRLLALMVGGVCLGAMAAPALAQNMCSPSTAPMTRYPGYPGSAPYTNATLTVTSNCSGPVVDAGFTPDPYAEITIPLPSYGNAVPPPGMTGPAAVGMAPSPYASTAPFASYGAGGAAYGAYAGGYPGAGYGSYPGYPGATYGSYAGYPGAGYGGYGGYPGAAYGGYPGGYAGYSGYPPGIGYPGGGAPAYGYSGYAPYGAGYGGYAPYGAGYGVAPSGYPSPAPGGYPSYP